MVDFWNLSDGDDIHSTSADFSMGGGNFAPIPDNTTCLAIIEEAKVDQDRSGNQFVSLRWSIATPAEYKNRKVFQKIWCLDDDPRKADAEKAKDKAKRMLFAIDKNAGGAFVASGKTPNDANLAKAFNDKQMQITLQVYEMQGDKGTITGNWVSAVSPKAGGVKSAPKPVAPKHDVDDDIPF